MHREKKIEREKNSMKKYMKRIIKTIVIFHINYIIKKIERTKY